MNPRSWTPPANKFRNTSINTQNDRTAAPQARAGNSDLMHSTSTLSFIVMAILGYVLPFASQADAASFSGIPLPPLNRKSIPRLSIVFPLLACSSTLQDDRSYALLDLWKQEVLLLLPVRVLPLTLLPSISGAQNYLGVLIQQ